MIGHGAPDASLLLEWSLPPEVVAGLVLAGGLYLWGARRVTDAHPRHPWPWSRLACFLFGLGAVYLALGSPVERYDTTLFWVHMVQHLLLIGVAAPLLMLGAPVTLVVRAASPRWRRRILALLHSGPVKVVTFPLVTWGLYAAVLWGTHFTPVFDEALRSPALHQAEHAAYLFAACLWWWPVVGLDPGRWKLSYPARMLYVFAAMPFMTFLGLALYSSDRVLYPAYADVARDWGPSVRGDQKIGAALMWVTGDVLALVVILVLFGAWMREEARRGEQLDAALDRERTAGN